VQKKSIKACIRIYYTRTCPLSATIKLERTAATPCHYIRSLFCRSVHHGPIGSEIDFRATRSFLSLALALQSSTKLIATELGMVVSFLGLRPSGTDIYAGNGTPMDYKLQEDLQGSL
jgi:hypothetical protein